MERNPAVVIYGEIVGKIMMEGRRFSSRCEQKIRDIFSNVRRCNYCQPLSAYERSWKLLDKEKKHLMNEVTKDYSWISVDCPLKRSPRF